MKKFLAMLLIAGCGCFITARSAAQEHDRDRLDGRLDAARNVLDSIMSTPDHAVPEGIARHARCHCRCARRTEGCVHCRRRVRAGRGYVPHRSRLEWPGVHSPGGRFVRLPDRRKGTDLVLVATNDRGFQDLLHDKFKIGGRCFGGSRSCGTRRTGLDRHQPAS